MPARACSLGGHDGPGWPRASYRTPLRKFRPSPQVKFSGAGPKSVWRGLQMLLQHRQQKFEGLGTDHPILRCLVARRRADQHAGHRADVQLLRQRPIRLHLGRVLPGLQGVARACRRGVRDGRRAIAGSAASLPAIHCADMPKIASKLGRGKMRVAKAKCCFTNSISTPAASTRRIFRRTCPARYPAGGGDHGHAATVCAGFRCAPTLGRGGAEPAARSRQAAVSRGLTRRSAPVPGAHKKAPSDMDGAGGLAAYLFLFSIICSIMGVRMISMAKPILPPGITSVLGRDIQESLIICCR